MKWFKHDSNASLDAKLQRLRLKFGMEAYGLYWYCLESVARNIEKHNISFELEEDAELISFSTNINQERVQEIISFMVELRLFEERDGRITCEKMATRTDEYTQRVLNNKQIKKNSRQAPDKVRPNRIERIDKNKEITFLRKKKTTIPDDFYLTPERFNKAAQHWTKENIKPEPDKIFSQFVSYHKAKKTELEDWEAGWQYWYENTGNTKAAENSSDFISTHTDTSWADEL